MLSGLNYFRCYGVSPCLPPSFLCRWGEACWDELCYAANPKSIIKSIRAGGCEPHGVLQQSWSNSVPSSTGTLLLTEGLIWPRDFETPGSEGLKNPIILAIKPTGLVPGALHPHTAFGHLPRPASWLLRRHSWTWFAFTVFFWRQGGSSWRGAQCKIAHAFYFLFLLFFFLQHIPGIVMCMHNAMWRRSHALAEKDPSREEAARLVKCLGN